MYDATALCARGLEKVLSNELKKEGFAVSSSGFGRVYFSADIEGLYRALMGLRTAERVMLVAGRFKALDFEELFQGIRKIPWEDFIPRDGRLLIDKVRVHASKLTSVPSIQSVSQKALYDRLKTRYRITRLPETGSDVRLRIYLDENEVSVCLDLCGDPLHKRGYRYKAGQAPLKETIAASLVLLSGWKRKYPLHDPFCGAGTIPIEAALYAFDIAPGLKRRFAIRELELNDRAAEDRAREALEARARTDVLVRISGSDSDEAMIRLAVENATRSGLAGKIKFEKLSMEECFSADTDGYLITNPPYGERMGTEEESQAIYREMSTLRDRFFGWRLSVIAMDEKFDEYFGEKPEKRREILNGSIPSSLFFYGPLSGGKE